MEKYGQRIVAARKHKRWSQSQLARELDLTQPWLSELEAGDATGSKHSYKIATKTGVNLHWLETGEGEMLGAGGRHVNPSADQKSESTIPEINLTDMPRDVPIFGGASCGEDGLFEFNGQVLDHAKRPPRLKGVPDVYAVYVHGESMVPWRENGELCYVHPHLPVAIGHYVLVQLRQDGEGQAMGGLIKKLVRRTATNIVLHQFNPEKDITIPIKKVGKIHRIMNWSEVLGF